MRRFIAFDLEGPLTPIDAAYELMGFAPNGHKIFERLSLYDDYLTLQGRPGYEPGFTLSLMTPFLARHQITADNLKPISKKAPLIDGARETILRLKREGFLIFVITTSPEPFALSIAQRLGIEDAQVFATKFPLGNLESQFSAKVMDEVGELEKKILSITDVERLHEIFDDFFWERLPKDCIDILKIIEVVGGTRKVEVLERLSRNFGVELPSWVVVGDSITDQKMLTEVRQVGGLTIVFNGNEYAFWQANVGVASENLGALNPVFKSWQEGGLNGVRDFVGSWPRGLIVKERERRLEQEAKRYCWIEGKERQQLEQFLEFHRAMRTKVRGKAGKLG